MDTILHARESATMANHSRSCGRSALSSCKIHKLETDSRLHPRHRPRRRLMRDRSNQGCVSQSNRSNQGCVSQSNRWQSRVCVPEQPRPQIATGDNSSLRCERVSYEGVCPRATPTDLIKGVCPRATEIACGAPTFVHTGRSCRHGPCEIRKGTLQLWANTRIHELGLAFSHLYRAAFCCFGNPR